MVSSLDCGSADATGPFAIGCLWCNVPTLLASPARPALPQDTLHGSLWWDVGLERSLQPLCKKQAKKEKKKEKRQKKQKKAITFPFFICSSSELFFLINYKRYEDCDFFFFLNYWCSIHSLLRVAVFCSWTTNDGSSWSNSCWAWGSAWL